MKSHLFLLPLLVTLTLVSCADNTTAPEASTGPILPLAVGNKWVGQTRKFNPDGTLLRTETYTSEVTGDTVLSGEKWYVINNAELMTNRSDGLYAWESSVTFEGALVALKHPATIGQSGRIATPLGAGTVTLVGIGEQVTVGGKSYTCSHYRMMIDGYENEIHWYLEPGKGWVKRETKMKVKNSESAFYTFELWEVEEMVLR